MMDGYDSDDSDITVDVDCNKVPSNQDADEEIANISSSDSVTPGEGDGDPADANDEEEDDVLQMPLRKLKAPAPVWKVAERVTNGAKCKICGKVYSCGGGTTSNIMNHMKLKHKSNEQVRKMIEELKEKKVLLKKRRHLKKIANLNSHLFRIGHTGEVKLILSRKKNWTKP